jgi:hypothetical protein
MALTKVNRGGLNTGISDSSDATAVTIDSSERATFNSNVSVGSSSFPSKFTVSHAGTDNIIETANTTNSVRAGMQADTSIVGMGAITNHPLVFRTNNAERARINEDGHLYVNTSGTDPSASQVGVRISGTQGQNFWKSANSGTGGYNHLNFYNGNGEVGSIVTSGSNTAYNTSSDYRLKESVNYNFDATTRVKKLKPCRFNFIADKDTTVDGFLAHEVQSVVPEAISGEKDATNEDGSIKPQAIDQSKLVPLLVKTIQELEARITALESA